LLNRPILFYAYDLEYYKNNLIDLVDEYEKCIIRKWLIKNMNEIIKILEEDLMKDKWY